MSRKLSPAIAPSKRCGHPRDPPRGEKRAGLPAPAGGVVGDARAARCPAVPPKQIGGAAGSSRHTRGATSQVGAAAGRPARPRRQADRSDGRTVFCHGQAEGPHGAPDRRHTRGLARASAQPACDPGAPHSDRPRAGAARACRAVPVAGREAPPRPCRAAAVSGAAPTTRSRGTSPPHRPPSSRHRCRGAPAPQIHHASRIGARRSTTTAPGVKAYLKSALVEPTNLLSRSVRVGQGEDGIGGRNVVHESSGIFGGVTLFVERVPGP